MTAIATNPLTYNGYITQIGVMAVVGSTTDSVSGITSLNDPNAQLIVPQMLNYAELRLQRDLDILPALTSNQYTLAAGSNQLVLGAYDFITVESIQAAVNSILMPVTPASKEFLQNVFNSLVSQGPPQYFAPIGGDYATGGTTSNLLLIGPIADQNYQVTVFGVQRLPSLYQFASSGSSAASSTTYLSSYYPDLLMMASMIYISAYQRNFGRMSDDPTMAQSYEGQYQLLLKSALAEESERRFEGDDWTAQPIRSVSLTR